MTRAIIWAAVSSKPQTEKDSLDQQQADAAAFATERGWQIADTLIVPGQSREFIFYHDAEGEIVAYRTLRQHCNARDFDVLICRGRDRLGRTDALIAQVEAVVRQAGARIHSLTLPGTGDARADAYLSAIERATAQTELNEFRRRSRDGMDGRAYRGLPCSPTLPFPYYRAQDPLTGRPAGPALLDDRGAAALREAAQVIIQGGSCRSAARHLNALGFTTRTGAPWHTANLITLLRNPFLAGQVIRHRVHYPKDSGGTIHRLHLPQDKWVIGQGQHQPIFTPAEWAALQAACPILPRGRPPISNHGIWAGLLYCAHCGYRLTPAATPHGNRRYVSYICIGRRQLACQSATTISERRVTRLICQALQILADEPDPASPDSAPPPIPDYTAPLADIARRERAAYLAYETGRITIEMYDERVKELSAQRADLQNSLHKSQAEHDAWEHHRSRRLTLREVITGLESLLFSIPPPQANALMKSLITRVTIRDRQVIFIE